jgi:hypothetical protein
MIVHLKRPAEANGPWLLYTLDWRVIDFVEPTQELSLMMEGREGIFEAESIEDGWDIKHRVVTN